MFILRLGSAFLCLWIQHPATKSIKSTPQFSEIPFHQYNKVRQPLLKKKLNKPSAPFFFPRPNFYSESAILYSQILGFKSPSHVKSTWQNTEGHKLKSSGANHSFQFLCQCSKVPHTPLFCFETFVRRVRRGVVSIPGAWCSPLLSLVLSPTTTASAISAVPHKPLRSHPKHSLSAREHNRVRAHVFSRRVMRIKM